MNTFLFRYFAFVLAVVTCCSALSIKPVTILPQIKALQDELCNGTAVAVKAISKIAPSYKVRALTWILGYQNNVLGPQTFTWINTVARANATLMASILLTEDASLFFDILNYMQFGDPNPYATKTSWINPCQYANDLMAYLKLYKNNDAAIYTQTWLLYLWLFYEKNYHNTALAYIMKTKATYDVLAKDPGLKGFVDLVLSV